MGSLLDELKRRRVFRAVFAWGIFSFAAPGAAYLYFRSSSGVDPAKASEKHREWTP